VNWIDVARRPRRSNCVAHAGAAGGRVGGLTAIQELVPSLVPTGSHKVGAIKNFHSLAPQAQSLGLAIGDLSSGGHVNPGYNNQIGEAANEFSSLARAIASRMGLRRGAVAA
jgi:hypothetical protein